MKKTLKIQTWLPCFNGFYGSYFEDFLEPDEEETEERTPEENQERMKEVAIMCCKKVAEQLTDFDVKITFEGIRSPKYYNFSNDVINCTMEFDKDKVLGYLYDNLEEFKIDVKDKNTSYEGFIAFQSNDFKDWLKALNKEEGPLEHMVGAIFDFILTMEGYDDYDLYQEIDL